MLGSIPEAPLALTQSLKQLSRGNDNEYSHYAGENAEAQWGPHMSQGPAACKWIKTQTWAVGI